MSFFGKIKQGLGIGTASLEVLVPAHFSKSASDITGKVVLTAKSDQKVKSIKVKLVELYTSGQGENKTTKEYVLGEMPVGQAFDIKADEQKEIEFTLPFSLKLSSTQAMAEKGGVLGAIGKAASFAASEKSIYQVRAVADLDGVAIDPNDTKSVRLE
jgi:sporulation-control protein spo0M